MKIFEIISITIGILIVCVYFFGIITQINKDMKRLKERREERKHEKEILSTYQHEHQNDVQKTTLHHI
jgi:hypothetical protein